MMRLENKSAKYICIIGGIVMILFALKGLISELNSTHFTGVITQTYEIEEYRVTNSGPNNDGDSPDDYDYKMYADVTANSQQYHVLLKRETQYTFPSINDSINLVQTNNGMVYEERKVRDNLALFILLGFGSVLLYGGITGKVKEENK